jgi:hypothetical protein
VGVTAIHLAEDLRHDRQAITDYVGVNGLNTIELETSPELRVVRRSSRPWYPAARFYELLPDGRTFVMENPLERGPGVQVAVGWGGEARRIWAEGQR